MNSEPAPSLTRSRLALIGILAVFVAPIAIAWLFASGVFDVHDRTLVNRGELLSPPIDLTPEQARPGFAPLFALAPSEWAIVYVDSGPCGEECAGTLDQLLVVREMLGQGAVRAFVHAVTAGPATAPTHAARVHADPAAVTWLIAKLAARLPRTSPPRVVLVDWRHQLVLHYPPDELRAIQQDLKRLLRASAIR
ncbi:MAG: hypothetical protein AB7V59_00240 [Gammaproteobacteria bacterium]